MNSEKLLLIRHHTDTSIKYTRARPRETLLLKINKERQIFSFNTPIISVEEDKWLLSVTSFGATNFVLNKNNDNKSFLFTIPDHWNSKSAEKTIGELIKLLELRSQSDIELHVQEVRKRGIQIKIEDR